MVERQRYKIEKRLDSGGMAEVFVGRAMSVGGIERPVAVKRILPSLTKKPKFGRMFLDEARLSMLLTHANIVQVFDVGRAADTYFIVMEYVDGWNLRRVFSRASELGFRIPLPLASFIMMEVCKGLAHAHEKRDENGRSLGIVHRDISPPNILISRSGEVKIVDFGLAKAVTQVELTDPGIVKGKFSYLSPEAAQGQLVDARADIFSAGTILFELLSNRQLFRGQNEAETLEQVRTMEPPPLSRLNHEVPPDFDAIVRRSLAKDPRRRFQSARELGEELASFLVSHNVKVTAYDLAAMLRTLFDDPEGLHRPHPAVRIRGLIEEEIANLASIGELQRIAEEGGQPLDLDASAFASVSSKYSFAALWAGDPQRPSGVAASPSRGTLGLSESLEGRDLNADLGLVADPRDVSFGGLPRWAWLAIGAGALALVTLLLVLLLRS